MTLQLNTVLKFRGEALKDSKGCELTLKETLVQGLLAACPQQSQDETYKKWSLVKKIESAGDSMDASIDELSLLKSSLKDFSCVVQGLCIDLMEGVK